MEELKIDPMISYDVVELPSRGIHYERKTKSLRIAYLTASDENILSSPNLIQSNGVVTELLKRKILDREIPVEELVEEDVQAILLFLRNTAFGTEYTLKLVDPKTKESFERVIDLSNIKLKEFDLVPDVNGEYPYTLPKSNVDITFKFLTKKQEEEVQKIKNSWNGVGVSPFKTKELEFMIKTIGGVRDQMQIHSFVENKMPLKDSQDFRKFVNKNKPGLDLNQKITTPSGEEIDVDIVFGAEFFRPFYGL